MRHFELRDDRSAKFWSIDLQGNRFTVRFGKIGTTGQTQTKEFASDAQARAEHDKIVAEKIKKGYVEAGGTAVPAPVAAPATPRAATKRPKATSPTPPPAVTPGPATAGAATLDGLLAAARAEPDDDTTRLVLADWLEEHGDSARAELIRVQCEVARRGVIVTNRTPLRVLVPGPLPSRRPLEMEPDAEIRALLDRERELLANHRANWLTGFPPDWREAPDTRFSYDFERGMLRLTVNVGQGRGGASLEPHGIQKVMNCLAALDAMAEQPAFAWVAQVEVDASGDSFGNTVDGGEDYAALFTHPALRHVTSLRLDWMFGGNTLDLTPLAARRDLDRLTDLSVDASNVEESAPIDADELWTSPAISNLRRLTFCGPASFLPLAQSTHLTRLKSLDTGFYHDQVGDPGLAALADSSYFPELQQISLRGSEGGRGYHPLSVLRLLLSPLLPSLEWVDFDFSDVDDEVWEEWAATFQQDLPEDAAGLVRTLTAIGDACTRGDRARRVCCGIELLLYSPGLSLNQDQHGGLQAPLPWDLSNTGLGDVVLAAIAASPQLAHLIYPSSDGDRSRKAESSRKKPPQGLTKLNLSNNTFGDAGALALAESPHAAGLQRLNVSGNRLSESALTRLRGRFPEVLFSPPRAG
jgi:uncharacterized protein (TIGR02996 family)